MVYEILTSNTLSPNGKWRTNFSTGGHFKTLDDGGSIVAESSPDLSAGLKAARVDSTATYGPGIHGELRCKLAAQNPNNTQPWYTIWPLCAYINPVTHIACTLKTNGWEISKKDNDLPIGLELQSYIASDSSPTAQRAIVGEWNTMKFWIVPDDVEPTLAIRLEINGKRVFDGLDWAKLNLAPTLPGAIYNGTGWQRGGLTGQGSSTYFRNTNKGFSFYSEASAVRWDDVYLSSITEMPA